MGLHNEMNPREGPQGAKALSDPEGLALDISRLELDRDSADMVFVVGREEARVSGHAAIFNVRCSKFVELVSNHTEENPQPGSITVRLSFLGNEAFLMFVHFVYSGRADVTQENLLELLAIAGLFGVPSLVRHCQSQLKASFSPQSAQSLLNDAAVVAPEAGDRQALARPLHLRQCRLCGRQLFKPSSQLRWVRSHIFTSSWRLQRHPVRI